MRLVKAKKIYFMRDKEVVALDGINLEIDEKQGKFYAIMGHSGSGKTTLIQILGLLDSLTEGEYFLDNKNVKKYKDNELAALRMKKIGFVFQNYHLNPYLKAFENVMLPMYINPDIPKKARRDKAIALLKQVKLAPRHDHYPRELSGGEQQRVAIARSLANDPDILLADEPTGNLDVDNEKYIFEMLKEISRQGKCVIVVSHNEAIKEYADVIYHMEEGKIL